MARKLVKLDHLDEHVLAFVNAEAQILGLTVERVVEMSQQSSQRCGTCGVGLTQGNSPFGWGRCNEHWNCDDCGVSRKAATAKERWLVLNSGSIPPQLCGKKNRMRSQANGQKTTTKS